MVCIGCFVCMIMMSYAVLSSALCVTAMSLLLTKMAQGGRVHIGTINGGDADCWSRLDVTYLQSFLHETGTNEATALASAGCAAWVHDTPASAL